MVEKLTKLHNTLSMIETKGENTKIMAECLRFIEQTISEEKQKQSSAQNKPEQEV